MLHPVHKTLFVTELLSWSLTLLVLASQQHDLEVTPSRHFHIWINGSHNSLETCNGTLASPAFPSTRFSLPTTYTFHFSHRSKHGFVRLNFDDFFLAPLEEYVECGSARGDYLKILDGSSVTTHCGQSRPQPYVSASHRLTIEYHYAETPVRGVGIRGAGLPPLSIFRAGYEFLSRSKAMEELDHLIRGYYVQETEFKQAGYGELYTGLSPVYHPRTVDYLWYIQASVGQQVHLNIIDLAIGDNTTLEVMDGISSASMPVASFHGNSSLVDGRTVTSSQEYVYVRWTGSVDGWSRLHIAFTQAFVKDPTESCPAGFFCCDSGVCVPGQRVCDTVPHCEQGEDEDPIHCPLASREGRRMLSRRQSTGPIDLSECHCENGGTCQRDEKKSGSDDDESGRSGSVNSYCLCAEEFFGDRCELMSVAKRHHLAAVIARCTCKNGGTCTPTSSGFGFVCSCSPGFRGYDCSHNDSIPNASSPAEYGIAMGAAVVAVLLVMFGVALCICVILQYLRQQRDGPESPYSRTLSRDVYSVEGVDIAGIQMETVEPNDYIPPTYNQCMHPSPSSPEGDVFLTPSQSSQFSIGSRWRVRTPESPPPTYDAILGFCKECSELAMRNMAAKQQQQQLATPSSDQFDTLSGVSSNFTTGPSSNYTTGNNTPSGPGPGPAPFQPPRAAALTERGGAGSREGTARGGRGGTTSQSQTDSPLEEFELRRVQST